MPAAGPTLAMWDDHWDLRPEDCPCDLHLVDWLAENRVRDAAIFHFGSGGHHHVGLACAKQAAGNSVLAITAAPREHESFVRLAVDRPELLRTYNVLFGDIYLLNERLLPEFDVVTLFHLGEYRSAQTDSYGGLSDLDVTRLLARRLKPGGHIFFYPGSYAWNGHADRAAKDVVAEWERDGGFTPLGMYRALMVYRKAG